jgi:hypothetical protein
LIKKIGSGEEDANRLKPNYYFFAVGRIGKGGRYPEALIPHL